MRRSLAVFAASLVVLSAAGASASPDRAASLRADLDAFNAAITEALRSGLYYRWNSHPGPDVLVGNIFFRNVVSDWTPMCSSEGCALVKVLEFRPSGWHTVVTVCLEMRGNSLSVAWGIKRDPEGGLLLTDEEFRAVLEAANMTVGCELTDYTPWLDLEPDANYTPITAEILDAINLNYVPAGWFVIRDVRDLPMAPRPAAFPEYPAAPQWAIDAAEKERGPIDLDEVGAAISFALAPSVAFGVALGALGALWSTIKEAKAEKDDRRPRKVGVAG